MLSPLFPGHGPERACKSGGELQESILPIDSHCQLCAVLFLVCFFLQMLVWVLYYYFFFLVLQLPGSVLQCGMHMVCVLGGTWCGHPGPHAAGVVMSWEGLKDPCWGWGSVGWESWLWGSPIVPSWRAAGGCVPAWVSGRSEILLTAMIISRVLTICCRMRGSDSVRVGRG